VPAESRRKRRLIRELEIGSSAVIFAGFAAARLLGFLFSVVAARALSPAGFGQVAYALALATIASVLLSSSPVGLSRYLARHADDRHEQEAYMGNWLMVVGVLLVLSLAASVPIALAARLDGWMMAGLAVNLVGVAVLETYREVQRGLGRFISMTVFYGLANLLQLVAVGAAALLGWRSPQLFVMIYGASSVAAWLAMERLAPVGLRLVRSSLDRERLPAVLRFVHPLLWQSVFFAVWFSADLVFVQWVLGPSATGSYAAAKTLANSLWLAPTAIGMTLVPRVARLPQSEMRRHVAGVVALTAVVTLSTTALLVVFGGPLLVAAFGDRYPQAVTPIGVLAAGMGLHGLYIVLFNLWVGLGRPAVNMVSAAAGMVLTLVAAALLVPSFGLLGAAWSFTLGSGVRLAIIAAYTAVCVGRAETPVPSLPTRPMAPKRISAQAGE
jgi:O-antigen/teichoic acid export membrane protein